MVEVKGVWILLSLSNLNIKFVNLVEHTSSICSISWGANYPGKQQATQRDAKTPHNALE